MLIAGVIHAEEEAGHESHHHDNHGALGVDTVVDMHCPGGRGGRSGGIEECLEAVVYRVESVQFAAGLEVGLYFVKKIA